MGRECFTEPLAMELRLQGVGFDLRALQEFVEASWPLIEDAPDVAEWARAFVEAGNVTMQA